MAEIARRRTGASRVRVGSISSSSPSGNWVRVGHGVFGWGRVAVQIDPDTLSRRHEETCALTGPLDPVALLGGEAETRSDFVEFSRLHLAEPFGSGDALDRPTDARVEPVGDTLGENVHFQ